MTIFVGSIPGPLVAEVIAAADVANPKTRAVYVCCSGAFRLEQAARAANPKVKIHSNDVSLLSSVIGSALAGADLPGGLAFRNDLSFLQDWLKRHRKTKSLPHLAAATMIASLLCRVSFDSLYGQRLRDHYIAGMDAAMTKGLESLGRIKERAGEMTYTPGDFRQHIDRALAEKESVIVASPPTYEGGYEQQYRRLEKNATWQPPKYDLFDPETIPDLIGKLEASGHRYAIVSDSKWKGLKARQCFARSGFRAIWLYSNGGKPALRRDKPPQRDQFKYEALDTAKLNENTTIQILNTDWRKVSWLREFITSHNVTMVDQPQPLNYLVYLDGMLAGGFGYSYYSQKAHTAESALLLFDFSMVGGARKIAKLIALLATSRTTVRDVEASSLNRVNSLTTVVYCDNPVSMKYRGVFKLHDRSTLPGDELGTYRLIYRSGVRDETPQALYQHWWHKHGKEKDAGKAKAI